MPEPKVPPAERCALGRRIAQARVAAGYKSAVAAAEASGVDKYHWYHMEAGRRQPTYHTLNRMVVGLGMDPTLLFGAITEDELVAFQGPIDDDQDD